VKEPVIAVLAGGTSAEREVSLGSGTACAIALARSYPTRLFDVTANALPAGLDPSTHVVFSTLHGTFGEDGGMQRLLEAAQVHYAGCDASSSALTMDKFKTKEVCAAQGVEGTKGILFNAKSKPDVAKVMAQFGDQLVVKPNDEGSSIGLNMVAGRAQLTAVFGQIKEGDWLVEQRVIGREFAIGVLGHQAMGIVEIRPKSGVYDYASKYTKGASEYFAPAPLDDAMTARMRQAAETAYRACGCRDYARVDFLLSGENILYLLEINTLPGMKETSSLPMSARCVGLDFTALVREMAKPALQRFHAATASTES